MIEADTESASHGGYFEILAPARWTSPLVLTSPHSGSFLPYDLIAQSHLAPDRLRRSEDAFVDELFLSCLDHGAPMMRALVSRAYVDLNREPYELDPRMFRDALPGYVNTATPRVLSGLGTIPRIVAEGEDIYRCKLDAAVAFERIEQVYRPFHHALSGLLNEAFAATGIVLLLDCHSMPDSAIAGHHRGSSTIDVVVGDRFGTSASSHFVNELEYLLAGIGLRVRRNRPYAGGFITETYGNPRRNQHAIQIELNRSLYMNEATLQKTSGFEPLRQQLATVLERFAAFLGAGQAQIAAE